MISTTFDKGMIFLCTDKCSRREEPMKHNYLIIGRSGAELGLVQAMAITSMINKDVTMEVPIKLCNDYVSYVVPYNLHSFSYTEIRTDNYKGTIVDTPRITKDEFLSLLMDVYLLHIGIKTKEEVLPLYEEYCRNFWADFQDCMEYRELKEYRNRIMSQPEPVTEITNEEINQIMGSIVNNTSPEPVVEKSHHSPKVKKGRQQGKHIHDKHSRYKSEEMEIEKMMREVVGRSSTELDPTTPIPSSKAMSPFHTGIKLEDLKKLNKAPRAVRNWTNNDLTLFIRGYREYGYSRIKTIIPDRWGSSSAMSACFKNVKEEAERRKLKVTIDPLKRPMKDWSDKELQQYIAIMNNHRFDTEFQLQYTGFETTNQCTQLTYNVKKELQSRGLITV